MSISRTLQRLFGSRLGRKPSWKLQARLLAGLEGLEELLLSRLPRWVTGRRFRHCRTQQRRSLSLALWVHALEDRVVPATITVNSLLDGATSAGQITLRQAIEAANTDASVNGSVAGLGADTIVFDPALFNGGAQSISLTSFSASTAGSRALFITSDVTIQGPTGSAGLTIHVDNTNYTGGIFEVSAAASLNLKNLTLSGGTARGDDMTFTTTTLATAVGAFTWPLLEFIFKGKPSVLGFCSGAVAGLVVITPACGFVNSTGAVIIGVLAGVIPYIACTIVKNIFKYDDALDTFGVHGVGGTVGALITGVLVDPAVNGNLGGAPAVANGLAKAIADHSLVVAQAKAAGITIALAVVSTTILAFAVKLVIGLRPSVEAEHQGLDITDHGEEGYTN